jgi:hypothetical protein
MSYCTSCGELLDLDEARSFAGELYCESCFEDQFNYCSDCDTVISREYTNYDDDGNPYCDECYNNRFDEDCPENPSVDDADRNLVIQLARNWLFNGKNKLPISINGSDEYLPLIREQVGLVENPIYLYGLIDRDEYEILVSEDIKPKVEAFISEYLTDIKIETVAGSRRMGLSINLRQHHYGLIVKLIKEVLTCAELPVTSHLES